MASKQFKAKRGSALKHRANITKVHGIGEKSVPVGAFRSKRTTKHREARRQDTQDGMESAVAEPQAAYVTSPPPKVSFVKPKFTDGKVARLRRQVAVNEEKQLAAQLVAHFASDIETSADVNVLCESYGLKREELGRLTGFSLRALADWAAGKVPSQPAHRRLHEVRRLLDALAELVKAEAITPWLQAKNPAFGNLTPLQVIEMGEIDRLWAMVHQGAAGPLD